MDGTFACNLRSQNAADILPFGEMSLSSQVQEPTYHVLMENIHDCYIIFAALGTRPFVFWSCIMLQSHAISPFLNVGVQSFATLNLQPNHSFMFDDPGIFTSRKTASIPLWSQLVVE
jgi:hypothetical protein